MIKANLPTTMCLTGSGEPLEFEAAGTPAEGQPPQLKRFNMVGYNGGPLRLPNFPHPVVASLEGMEIPSQSIPILKDHERSSIVGHSLKVDKTSKQIKASGVISGTGPAAQEVLALAANSYPWSASIGAEIHQLAFIAAGESVVVNGRKVSGPAYHAVKSTLREISVVAVGADSSASTSVAASAKGITMNDFDRWLVANGFDPNTVSDSQRAILKASFEASKAPATPPPATPPAPAPQLELDAIIATRRADQQRRTEIAALYEKYTENRPDFVAEAEKICKLANSGGMTASETELQLLRASRVNVDVRGWVGHNGDNGQINAPVMEASLLRSMGWDRAKLEKRFPVPVLEAADRQYRHGLELSETFLTFARKNGHRGYTLNASNLESVLKAAFHEDIRADGPSTISLPGILSNVSNLSIQDHFNSVDAAWREIAAIGTVNDFKEMTSYSLTGDLTYDQIAPGGEIKHGKLDETEYGNKADSYGKMLSVDRRDLINDNLGAFNAINRKLGRGGALKLNLVFWTELLDNTDFFKTANANYDAGTDSAFDSDGLESADNIFRNQTDPDGNPLGALAKILLVPTGLRIPALRLMTSQKVMEDSTAGDSNPWANMFRVVSSPYLTNANIPGYSTVKWYLFADPNDLPVIQVVFLNGVQLPTVETVQMDINRLGITHRAVFDFGVRKQEYRGGVAMKGEN